MLVREKYSADAFVYHWLPDKPVLETGLCDFGRRTSRQGFTSLNGFDITANPAIKEADLVHLHNIHPDYFNLFCLPALSHQKPIVWTLHDEYAYTGHCACTLDCGGWLRDCSPCPYLNRYLDLREDTASELLELKRRVYAHSRLTLVTPSQWLANRVRRSILKGHPVHVIPNGIDTTVFREKDQLRSRTQLGLPLNRFVVAFCADDACTNPWKGGDIVLRVYESMCNDSEVLFVSIGGKAKGGRKNWVNVPYVDNRNVLASYYAAADVLLYPTRADTFGLVVAEAMACGLPVIASDVGAIPELVLDGKTGLLAPVDDVASFGDALSALIHNQSLCATLGKAAVCRIASHFNEAAMIERYRNLYDQLSAV